MPTEDDNGFGAIKVNTPIGPVVARGTVVILVMALLAMAIYLGVEMNKRSTEHDEVLRQLEVNRCLNRLTIYQNTLALRGEHIDMRKLPADLWACMPKFLEQESQQRSK